MKHYIELTLITNGDINTFSLWSKLYQQLHLGLVEVQDDNHKVAIGLAFPEYRMDEKFGILGSKLRIFAHDEATLTNFNTAKWLSRLSDYVHCTSIRPVPENVKAFAVYQRMQPVTSKERLARRYAKRKNLSYEQALAHYQDMPNKVITFPFIRLKSLSNGLEFCLWIKKIASTTQQDGNFSTYGLSRATTVPEF